MLISTVEVIFLFFYIILFFMFFHYKSSIKLLLVSEVVWVLLYVIYCLVSFFTDSFELIVISITIFVLATIDVSTWIFILIFLQTFTTPVNTLTVYDILNFMLRARSDYIFNDFIY